MIIEGYGYAGQSQIHRNGTHFCIRKAEILELVLLQSCEPSGKDFGLHAICLDIDIAIAKKIFIEEVLEDPGNAGTMM